MREAEPGFLRSSAGGGGESRGRGQACDPALHSLSPTECLLRVSLSAGAKLHDRIGACRIRGTELPTLLSAFVKNAQLAVDDLLVPGDRIRMHVGFRRL